MAAWAAKILRFYTSGGNRSFALVGNCAADVDLEAGALPKPKRPRKAAAVPHHERDDIGVLADSFEVLLWDIGVDPAFTEAVELLEVSEEDEPERGVRG